MIQIVNAKYAHVPEIVEIWKEFIDFHMERDAFFTRSEDGHLNFEKHVRKLIESENSRVLVALDGGKVVAYSIAHLAHHPPVFKNVNYGFISDIAVRQEYRRKGIGGDILHKIKNWFSKQGITRIELRVSSKNEVAQSFWIRQLFKEYVYVMYSEI
ncbi:MAG: hypothetical protein COZ69_04380 [Deltaproteobacteria bacterium CG_4_8_14_3_um_filter_45_9]|nr:MAG: hypothetical protein COS40_15085 [Deltaproteobacteria bacterium CG03_land_8_20_14_0_80_45_14]PIX25101.1 MAG: hypothetical protein COZ69_04380 [Deltaproteobacteria bacterium CG_4_8_14_3_um_filter_45_9]